MQPHIYKPHRHSQLLDVILPSVSRLDVLPLLLTSLVQQDFQDFNVFLLDQHPGGLPAEGASAQAVELLRRKGVQVVATRASQSWPRYGDYRLAAFRLGSAPLLLMLDEDVVLTDPHALRRLVEDAQQRPAAFHALDIAPDAGGLEQQAPLPIWLRPRVVFGNSGGCVLLRRSLIEADDVASFFAQHYSHGDDLIYSLLTAQHGPGRVVGFCAAHMVDGNTRVHPTWDRVADPAQSILHLRFLWQAGLVYGLEGKELLPEAFYSSPEGEHIRRFFGTFDSWLPPTPRPGTAGPAESGRAGRGNAPESNERHGGGRGPASYQARYAEACALAAQPTPEGVQRLLESFLTEPSSLKAILGRVLAGLVPQFPGLREQARRVLSDREHFDWYTQTAAVRLLAHAGLNREDVELLVGLGETGDECLETEILMALLRSSAEAVSLSLHQALGAASLSPKQQVLLLDALGMIARRASQGELRKHVAAAGGELRFAVLRNWRLVDSHATGAYQAALSSDDPRDRLSCLYAAPFLEGEDTAEQLLSLLATSNDLHELRLAISALSEQTLFVAVTACERLRHTLSDVGRSLLERDHPWSLKHPTMLLLLQVNPGALTLCDVLQRSDPKMLRNYDYYRQVVRLKIAELLPTTQTLLEREGSDLSRPAFNLLFLGLDLLLDWGHPEEVARRSLVTVSQEELCEAARAVGCDWLQEQFSRSQAPLEKIFWAGWLAFAQQQLAHGAPDEAAGFLEKTAREESSALGLLALELLAAVCAVVPDRLLEKYAASDDIEQTLVAGRIAVQMAAATGRPTLPASWARDLTDREQPAMLRALRIRYGSLVGALREADLRAIATHTPAWSLRREVRLARSRLD